ncbi:uncharacterized protein LOC120340782 [Styela clava]
MTMPSVDCPTPFATPHARTLVLDRIKQRFNNYGQHTQKCADRYSSAQQTIRANERRDTALLWQKVQELKNKKGMKTKDSRQKISSVDTNDNDSGYLARAAAQSLKRKLENEAQGYGDSSMSQRQQQEAKKMKNDPHLQKNNQRQEYQIPNVSVQIVQNFGNDSAKQIETTVNVQHSSRNMSDSQSVSVNVGPKNIKQEMVHDNRQGQQLSQQNMNQQQQQQCPPGAADSNDLSGFDLDLDMNTLDELLSHINDDIIDDIISPDGQQSMTSQSQPMTSPYTHNMTSQSHVMTSQTQHMTSSQSQQMASMQRMSSPGQHMTSPPMTSQMMQQQQNAKMYCKSEKVDMFPGFRGNTPENKQENIGLPRQNSMSQQNISANIMTQQSLRVGGNNFSANLSSQQNISLNMSTLQQQQNNYATSGRQMPSNNSMTSQHIQRLNQVAQFAPHEAPPPEPPRLCHPPAGSHGPQSQANYYESHSQQLKQLAEKTRYGSMSGSGSVNMPSDPRSTQHFPPHYRGNIEVPSMSQQINLQSHHQMPPGGQRLSHMDSNMYGRPAPFVQTQRSSMMMQQSIQQEAIMMRQQHMQNNSHPYYGRISEPHSQQVLPTNVNVPFPGNAPHPSWNSRGAGWPSTNPHNPMHRPQVTPEQVQRPMMNSVPETNNYIPEFDQDLNILAEILSKANP